MVTRLLSWLSFEPVIDMPLVDEVVDSPPLCIGEKNAMVIVLIFYRLNTKLEILTHRQ